MLNYFPLFTNFQNNELVFTSIFQNNLFFLSIIINSGLNMFQFASLILTDYQIISGQWDPLQVGSLPSWSLYFSKSVHI